MNWKHHKQSSSSFSRVLSISLLLLACSTMQAQASGPDSDLGVTELTDRQNLLVGRFTPDDVLEARRHVSPIVAWIIDTEVGGVGYDPYAVGRAGELGCAQLHPQGLLPEYRRWSDNASPFNCATAAQYIEHVVKDGRGCNWTAYKRRYC